jgi:hypothetical protein
MAVTPPPRPPGSDSAHPLFVRQSPETPAPGHTGSPDPIVVATQQTAQYTLDLAIATFLLFLGTIIARYAGGATSVSAALSTIGRVPNPPVDDRLLAFMRVPKLGRASRVWAGRVAAARGAGSVSAERLGAI